MTGDISIVGQARRRRLPNRRPSVTETITFGQAAYEATLSFDQLGRPRELFLSGARDGSQMSAILQDTAVTISVSLQHGISASALARSIARVPFSPDEPPTEPASIIGVVLDWLSKWERGG